MLAYPTHPHPTHVLQPRPTPFSDPFIMRLEPNETVGQLRARVQQQRRASVAVLREPPSARVVCHTASASGSTSVDAM